MSVTHPLVVSGWGEEELQALERSIRSGRHTMGETVRRFENAFAAKVGARHAVMVNSGSSANMVALAALRYRRGSMLRPGDEVIVPALAWSTTWSPLAHLGMRVRVADIDLETLNIDPARVESLIGARTRMVIAVNILGNPAPLPELAEICRRHELILFEDNCESLGAEVRGRACGTWGHIGTFSFFWSHHISTMEGGMVVTDDRELADLCRSLRANGWTRELLPDSPLFETSPVADRGSDFDAPYHFVVPGFNVRPLEHQAAVGEVQLGRLDGLVAARRRNAETFREIFGGHPLWTIQKENGRSSWFAFTLINQYRLRRPYLMALREAGIGCRMITGGSLLEHDMKRWFHLSGDRCPNAQVAHHSGFFVGNHPHDLGPALRRLREVLDAAS